MRTRRKVPWRNWPLVDGNKRVDFAIGVFLSINGYKLVAGQVDAIQTMLAVAAGELDESGLAAWIQRNSIPTPKPRAKRRAQERRMKSRARRIMRLWAGRRRAEFDPRDVGVNASTHCRPCSCWMCQPCGKELASWRERIFDADLVFYKL